MAHDESLRARPAPAARDIAGRDIAGRDIAAHDAAPRRRAEERVRVAPAAVEGPVGPRSPAPARARTIRVLLIEDVRASHPGMRVLLRGAPDIEVVGETVDWVEGLAIAERVRPDVVILDADLTRVDGVAAVRYLVGSPVPTRVLLLVTQPDPERLRLLLAAGASSHLTRGATEGEVVGAVRAVFADSGGDGSGSGAAVSSVQAEYARKLAIFRCLSDREQVVFRLTAEGFNGSEIGRTLGISPKTVDTYRSRIEEKLGTRHRVDYVRFALDIELLHR